MKAILGVGPAFHQFIRGIALCPTDRASVGNNPFRVNDGQAKKIWGRKMNDRNLHAALTSDHFLPLIFLPFF